MNTNPKAEKTRLYLQKKHSSRNFFSGIPFTLGTSHFFQAQSNMTEMLLIGFSLTFQVKNRKIERWETSVATNRTHKTYFGPNK